MMLCDHTWAATKAPEHPGTSLECSPQSWNIFPSEAGKAGLLDGRVGLTCWRWEEKEEAEGSCLEARKGLQSQETWRSHGGFSSHTAVTVEKGVAGLSWCPSLPERQGGGGRAAGGLFGVGAQVLPVYCPLSERCLMASRWPAMASADQAGGDALGMRRGIELPCGS